MKKIILMLILMLGIGLMSCNADQEEVKNDSEVIMKDLSTYENVEYKGVVYKSLTGEEAEKVIAVVNNNCNTCKVDCHATKDGCRWLVNCDDNTSYYVYSVTGGGYLIRKISWDPTEIYPPC